VWTDSDFQKLQVAIGAVMPYSHYFQSGTIGSGTCLFSKLPILETLYHGFQLNGYAHKVHHGDWFGGKGVGLCKIRFRDKIINMFNTHLHAEYSGRPDDEYLAHRVAQAFEMSQFIKNVSETCDVVIIGGDFNLEPTDLGYKIIRTNALLRDSWLHLQHGREKPEGSTCDVRTNSFVSKKSLEKVPEGKRIDYIMYRGNPGTDIVADKCEITMGKVPGKQFNFSDHEGVAVTFNISNTEKSPSSKSGESPWDMLTLLDEAETVIDKGLVKARSDNNFYTVMAVLSMILFYGVSGLEISFFHIPLGYVFLKGLLIVTFTLMTAFFVWYKLIVNRIEVKGLRGTKNDIHNLKMTVKSK
ncbi:hypothetical protein FSP39_024625, partial [Pinctada imbricata]